MRRIGALPPQLRRGGIVNGALSGVGEKGSMSTSKGIRRDNQGASRRYA
jgi:hypothetical protein